MQAGHEVYVLGFNEQLKEAIPGVHYIPLGSNQNKINFLQTSLSYGLKSGKLFSMIGYLLNGNKKQIQQLNLSYVLNSIQPEVIHLQWVSNIKLFEDFCRISDISLYCLNAGIKPMSGLLLMPIILTIYSNGFLISPDFILCLRLFPIKGDKIYHSKDKLDQVVYTGLNLEDFPFQEQVADNDQLQLLSVGRPHWKKDMI